MSKFAHTLVLATAAAFSTFMTAGVAEAAGCKSGYVWRDAKDGDGVCVTPAERAEAKQQNAAKAFTGTPSGGCRSGYVWRDAWNGDGVCVTPFERSKAKQQNAMGPSRSAPMPTPTTKPTPSSSGVPKSCSNGVCGRATFEGTRVNIYLTHTLSGITHYNFKTNPGAQIEIKGNYSFNPPAASGTYSAQACKRGGTFQKSICSGWATFTWRAS